MSSIEDIITELASISGALGNEISDRARRPRRDPTAIPPSGRVHSNSPQFDSSEWGIRNPRLWEEEKERTRRTIEEGGYYQNPQTGIEALAWYVSFHDDQQNWGVYIPLSSVALMDELYLSGLPIDRDRRLHIAWSALLAHEQMHFAVDHACAWFELLLRAPIRREFTARFKEKTPAPHLKAEEAYLEVEETAANAHMLRELARGASRQSVGGA